MEINRMLHAGFFSETGLMAWRFVSTSRIHGQIRRRRKANQGRRERLEELLKKIQEQGKKLGQTPTFPELKSYRELVKKFMSEAVGQMYEVDSGTGWDRRGRQKAYTLVKKVDDTLEALTEDVRHGQERQLAVLEKMDSIRGMLVDLYT